MLRTDSGSNLQQSGARSRRTAQTRGRGQGRARAGRAACVQVRVTLNSPERICPPQHSWRGHFDQLTGHSRWRKRAPPSRCLVVGDFFLEAFFYIPIFSTVNALSLFSDFWKCFLLQEKKKTSEQCSCFLWELCTLFLLKLQQIRNQDRTPEL